MRKNNVLINNIWYMEVVDSIWSTWVDYLTETVILQPNTNGLPPPGNILDAAWNNDLLKIKYFRKDINDTCKI